MLTGIAQQEEFLSVTDATSNYLGEGWSSLTIDQELSITIKNQLTMTTGLDYNVEDAFCTDPECLIYLNDIDTTWYYHNAFLRKNKRTYWYARFVYKSWI